MDRVLLKDQLAKLQTVTATQISQLYLQFFFVLPVSFPNETFGWKCRKMQHICLSFTDDLGGMDEAECICFIPQKAMLKEAPRCSKKSQNQTKSRIWFWHKFLDCSHCISVVNLPCGTTPGKTCPFPLWSGHDSLFHDSLSILSPKTDLVFWPVPADIKNGSPPWWNSSLYLLLLGETSSCRASSLHEPSGATATLNNSLLRIYVLSQLLSCGAIHTHGAVLKHSVKPEELVCCAWLLWSSYCT